MRFLLVKELNSNFGESFAKYFVGSGMVSITAEVFHTKRNFVLHLQTLKCFHPSGFITLLD